MQIDIHRLDAALDKLLEAALDPSHWPNALNELAHACAARGVCVLPIVGRLPGVPATESIGEALAAYYEEGWHLNDFRERGIPHLARKGIVLDQDYASNDEIGRHSYYKFLRKYQLGWSAMVGFHNGQDMLCLVLHRSFDDGPFSDEESQHLVKLRERLDLVASVMRAMSESRIDGVAYSFEIANLACIFFDRFGKVTTINRSAQQLLGRDFHIKSGELTANAPKDTVAIRISVGCAVKPRMSGGLDQGPVVVPRLNKRPLVLRIQPLPARMFDIFRHSVAIAVVEDLDQRMVTTPQTLKQLFGLTVKEAAIALDMATGAGVRETADRAGLSYETVRSYLKTIYQKTGTCRQSELGIAFDLEAMNR